jgi:hypothetical protein
MPNWCPIHGCSQHRPEIAESPVAQEVLVQRAPGDVNFAHPYHLLSESGKMIYQRTRPHNDPATPVTLPILLAPRLPLAECRSVEIQASPSWFIFDRSEPGNKSLALPPKAETNSQNGRSSARIKIEAARVDVRVVGGRPLRCGYC